jgi:phosphatidylglycerophosphatase A
MNRLAILLATWGYAGYFPIAPGTVGSAAALVAYLAVRWTGSAAVEASVAAVLFAAGIWAAQSAEKHFGRTDPGYIVIDEVVGMLVTLLFLPVTWKGAVAGFLLFRLFDIVKPFPAARCERLYGGFGVMMDDLVAGIYGNLALRALVWLVPAAL